MRAAWRPRDGGASGSYSPSCQFGSLKIAWRCASLQAICHGEWRPPTAMGTMDRTKGPFIAHSSTCMPPIEPPMAAATRRTPRLHRRRWCRRTVSRGVTAGNVAPYGRPVAGSSVRGDTVPYGDPITLAQITKYRSVSRARPGPIRSLHQPATSASPVRA